jgi:3-oxoacyl-[acyl-carrier protein] reductase
MAKTALITGGGRGIGRGISQALAENGWQVVINYHGNRQAADETVADVRNRGGQGLSVQADIAQAADRQRLVTTALDEFGYIDLLVNNAGMAPRQRVDILTVGEISYDQVMATNLKGPFFLTQQVANMMIANRTPEMNTPAQIINISSISAYTSSPTRGEYCLSKAGLGMSTALFADRLAEYGIGVYEIRPGVIATDMTSGVKDKYDQLFTSGLTPINRWGTPTDVAKAVVAITAGYFPYSTGEVFNVDGGFHMRRL